MGKQELDSAYQTPRDTASKLRMWFDPSFVCVLTIGKTASSAIIEGLIEADVSAYQAHSLARAPQEYLFVAGLPPRPLQNAAFQLKVKTWLAYTRTQEKRFITTFRDPFSRNLSAFFEQCWKLNVDVENLETDELVKLYNRHGPHDATKNWFKDNLAKPFGLELDQLNLRDQPTQILSSGRRQFLLMKYEDRATWEEEISHFVDTQVKLVTRNVSGRKSYSEAIANLKNEWRPSEEIIHRTIDLDLWDAIYTPSEKESIRDLWSIPSSLAP